MAGHITGNTGITTPQTYSTRGAEQSQNLTASRPGALNRTGITTYPPRKNLSKNSEKSSRPAPTPLANRQAAIKTKGLSNLLKMFKAKIKNLGQPSRPATTPAARHQAATKPASRQPAAGPQRLADHLNVFKKQIENLEKEPPTNRQEKKLRAIQIQDTLKGIKQLSKNLQNQYREVIIQHNEAETFTGTETPENKAEYQKLSKALDVINRYIKTLKAMR